MENTSAIVLKPHPLGIFYFVFIGFPPAPTLACPSESRNEPYRVFCFFFGGSGRCGGDGGGGYAGGDAGAEGGFSSRWTNFDPGSNEFVSAMTRLALNITVMKVLFTSIVLNTD